jgi:predicted phage terminase large subunit-like protein
MSKTVSQLDLLEYRTQLWGSLLHFCQVFYPMLSGRKFIISQPVGRESHFVTISKALTRCARLQSKHLIINVPPGHGKSIMVSMWVAWTLAKYPDSRYLYISYGKTLAAKHTEIIRRIINLPDYRALFDVSIRHDSKAKDFFQTTHGGVVAAFGASGSITGFDSGLPDLDRFSGATIIDDSHKPDEVHSDKIRQSVIENYRETIQQRTRGVNVPTIFIGQRLHEDDLPAYFIAGKDGHDWERVIIPAIDAAGNALYPEAFPLEILKTRKERDPYVFASQLQQDPIPAGGALYKEKNFVILRDTPTMLCTFITCDTAETSKSHNDASAFSFWGLYKITENGQDTGLLGLHWIDTLEVRVEPKDLYETFMDFYGDCMLFPVKPLIAAIEKKSTGVTLISILQDMRGLQIRDVKRTKASGSKTARFLEMQPIISAKLVSFTEGARHLDKCIKHMLKITANDSHAHDDIADTLYDAIKIGLIDRTIYIEDTNSNSEKITRNLATSFNRRLGAFGSR